MDSGLSRVDGLGLLCRRGCRGLDRGGLRRRLWSWLRLGHLFLRQMHIGLGPVRGPRRPVVLDGADSSLRLAYSGVTPAEIEEGVKRLAGAYHQLIDVEAVDAA